MRLDKFLAEKGCYKSRTRAANAIGEGLVSIRGRIERKASFEIDENETEVYCLPDPLRYVGRGALKLEYAVSRFGIDVSGKNCADIGASTGGFTQVLLEKGAAYVAAVDVGHGQLDPLVSSDPRVGNFEGTDARAFDPGRQFDFLSMDVSFISVSLMKETVLRLLKPGGIAVILFKPQFEVGRGNIGKGGIVRSDGVAVSAMDRIVSDYESSGLMLIEKAESPIKGGDGNTEYLLYFKKEQ